MTRLLRI
ncbi:uncharacterized protein FFMR_09145 [Fusarium fujikuroi]|nr:uncharacterized protein FFC1_04962 [Fusarium fujikuroi]SCO33939.1 uncharacterized protein FFNC_03529 [Fusarium fujikuroi]SCO48354.1 uncharacterized protein FFMR_09145 [Fusarium fujikuroi]